PEESHPLWVISDLANHWQSRPLSAVTRTADKRGRDRFIRFVPTDVMRQMNWHTLSRQFVGRYRRSWYGNGFKLFCPNSQRPNQCGDQYSDRRHNGCAGDRREPKFNITSTSDVFDNHAIGTIAANWLKNCAAN